jgi:DNA-directed RNA polymerase specialized sigma24 family protein
VRYIEGVELTEGAALLRVSLPTFKRRLQAARARLWASTGHDPVLAPYLAAPGAATQEGP